MLQLQVSYLATLSMTIKDEVSAEAWKLPRPVVNYPSSNRKSHFRKLMAVTDHKVDTLKKYFCFSKVTEAVAFSCSSSGLRQCGVCHLRRPPRQQDPEPVFRWHRGMVDRDGQ